jgi:hypothetical protein
VIAEAQRATVLTAALERLDMDVSALWLDYVALAGNMSRDVLRRWLGGEDPIPDHDYNTLAHALNEAFSERDQDSPVPYADE